MATEITITSISQQNLDRLSFIDNRIYLQYLD